MTLSSTNTSHSSNPSGRFYLNFYGKVDLWRLGIFFKRYAVVILATKDFVLPVWNLKLVVDEKNQELTKTKRPSSPNGP